MTAVPVLQRTRTLAIVLVLSGATLLTAACGGSDGDDAADASPSGSEQASSNDGSASDEGDGESSSTPDPCTLVTAADLQAAWGVEFHEGELTEGTPPIKLRSCGFGQVSNEPPARTLTVSIVGNDGLDDAMMDNGQTTKTLYEGVKDMATDPQPLEGLGDDAYRNDSQIEMLAGDMYVTVTAPGASSPEAIAGLEQLAEVVAGNL
jgi:hypothetical protein